MAKVIASITTSVDGYITGPNDGPEMGLGEGGERLHYWVFGGPWSYDNEPQGNPTGEDAEFLAQAMSRVGAVVAGRGTYEAARHWGDKNPFAMPMFVVTHRPEEEPADGEFEFVAGVEAAVERATEAAGKALFDGFTRSLDLERRRRRRWNPRRVVRPRRPGAQFVRLRSHCRLPGSVHVRACRASASPSAGTRSTRCSLFWWG